MTTTPPTQEVTHCVGYCERCGQRCVVRAVDGQVVTECQDTRCVLLQTTWPGKQKPEVA